MFAHNFQIAVFPQIVKYYASGEREKMANLVINSAKVSAALLLVLMMPLLIDAEFVLNIWLEIIQIIHLHFLKSSAFNR